MARNEDSRNQREPKLEAWTDRIGHNREACQIIIATDTEEPHKEKLVVNTWMAMREVSSRITESLDAVIPKKSSSCL